jgi:hypothetical protein
MTRRERLVIGSGAGLLVLALLVLRLAPALIEAGRALGQRRQARLALLAETRAMVGQLPMLEDSARHLTRALAGLAPSILSGHTAAEATADLSSRLSLLANRSGCRIESLRGLPDSASAGSLKRVSLQLGIETDAAGLVDLLGAVGRHSVVLVPERASISTGGGFNGDHEAERLRIELTVSGWFLARDEPN